MNQDGTYTLSDPAGNLIAAYEVALITALQTGSISFATWAGHDYKYMQFRTSSGGGGWLRQHRLTRRCKRNRLLALRLNRTDCIQWWQFSGHSPPRFPGEPGTPTVFSTVWD